MIASSSAHVLARAKVMQEWSGVMLQ